VWSSSALPDSRPDFRPMKQGSDALDGDHWNRVCQLLAGPAGDLSLWMPFCEGDVTAGSETELQAVVAGKREDVDLPLSIEASNYFANLKKRSAAQDTPKRTLRELERFLSDNHVWDNSWVRFPQESLCPRAWEVLQRDLLADKSDPDLGLRRDHERFVLEPGPGASRAGERVRVPISYLLKLSLADLLGRDQTSASWVTASGALLGHYLNDNISPETYSFYVTDARAGRSVGQQLAKETSQRYLLTQLLTMYANEQFGLKVSGQEAQVYFSPHPPLQQQRLNDCIPDAFYRDLFTSPCLSGWDRGEDKQQYMRLCHEVLGRAQLHAIAKVRDAGLIASNLVLLPNVSNTSLSNNGIHVSLGSRRLQQLMEDPDSGFGPVEEKAVSDLVIKIVEHFLPLFVGTYSAAPRRFDFADFHTERVLGFLPHEVDFTHLRMIWRRWKKKASCKIFGSPITPSGIGSFDRFLARLFFMRGDYVEDYRLIDYLAAPLSTDQSPALDGRLGNQQRLKCDLADQGEYDTRMAYYMLFRGRNFETMGFSGFEGRYYSLCESLIDDLGPATDLQMLITALAFQYVATGKVRHGDIPDDPCIESERRQIFFGAAAGIPTFFVRQRTTNRFLGRILQLTKRSRASRRYPGYQRIHNHEYRLALVELLKTDGAALLETGGMADVVDNLEARLRDPALSAAGKLRRGILDELNVRSPLSVRAADFHLAAERYYREKLRRQHLIEGLTLLEDDWSADRPAPADLNLPGASPLGFLRSCRSNILAGAADSRQLQSLVRLMLVTIDRHRRAAGNPPGSEHASDAAPVYSA